MAKQFVFTSKVFLNLFIFYSVGIILPVTVIGQTVIIEQHTSLEEALIKIQDEVGWIFNYDPKFISEESFESTLILQLHSKKSALNNLLESSSLEFEIKNDNILLIPLQKKKYKICGSLKDIETGTPLVFGHIYLDKYLSCWTDDSGYFSLEIEGYKNDVVHISYLGYEKKNYKISELADDCSDIFLNSDPFILANDIIIRDYILSSISQGNEYSGTSINLSDLNKEIGSVERDVLKTVQFLPGISSLDESASNLTIRGAEPDKNLIFWEDAPLYNSGHFFGMISSVNPFIVNQVEVYKGSYSSEYDNRIGGVVDISLDDDIPDEWHIGLGSTMTEAHVELSLPVKNKLGLTLAARRSITDILDDNPTLASYEKKLFASSVLFLDDDENENSDSEASQTFGDLNAKLSIQANDKIYIGSSILSSYNSFVHSYVFPQNQLNGYDSLDISTQVFANKLRYSWNKNSESELKINLSKYRNEYAYSLDEAGQDIDILNVNFNDITDFQTKLVHNYRRSKFHAEIAYVFDRKKIEHRILESNRYEEDLRDEQKRVTDFHHLYFDAQTRIRKWVVDFGNRASYSIAENSLHFAPRLNVSRALSSTINVRTSYGLFNQYIKQLENFSQSHLSFDNRLWVLDTEEIMRSRKAIFGASYSKNNLLVDFDAYHIVSSGIAVLTSGQNAELEIDQSGSSSSRGIELLVKHRWGSYRTGLSVHIGSVDFELARFDDEKFPANNDQRLNVSFINQYKLKHFSFGLNYSFRSGLPYSIIENLKFVEQEEDDYYELELEGLNNRRLPYLHRIDCFIAYRKSFLNTINVDLQLSLLNSINSQVTTSRSYILSNTDMSTDEPEILEEQKFQLPRTPQLLLRITF